MPPLDAEIDRLYQLPLGEFTAARNALAARAGDRRASVKSLQKPNTAAWAINQLYWQRKPVYDELVRTSERLRAAHARTLSGKKAYVTDAESAHAAALKRAADGAQALLTEAGERASPQVMNDVRETLQALPSDDPPGRLTRPLQPLGFGALLAMLPAAARSKLSAVEPAEKTAADTRGARGHDADRRELTAAGK
jgi:hypothetical protein